ncbi:MAG: sulfatase, partial [Planctomycetota bacterium]
NIVMAFADDWGYYASAYGKLSPGGVNDVISTPNFDSIANDGVLFTNAFVSAPSCTPCRSSLMSGQPFYRCRTASILSGAKWDFSLPAYPLLLEESGYRIGHTYKVWSPGSPGNAPHGGHRTAFNQSGFRFNRFSQFAMSHDDPDAAKAILLDEVRGNMRSFFDADADGVLDGDQPVCYFFGPTNTHRKWIAGSGLKLWGVNPDALKGKLPAFLPDVHKVREDFADYLGEAMAFDAALGVLNEELERLGIADNTLLVVSGDHGVPGIGRGKCNLYDLGTHVPLAVRWPNGIKHPGRVSNDFVSLPELAPTFLNVANVPVPASMIARPITPLLASDQSDQIDPERSYVITGRERHVATARAGMKPFPQRAIQTRDWLFIINFEPERTPMGYGPPIHAPDKMFPDVEALTENTGAAYPDLDASPTKAFVVTNRRKYPIEFEMAVGLRPEFELYNLQTDPDCMTNLADQAEYAETRSDLQSRLLNELKATGDPRLTSPVMFEQGLFIAKPDRGL